MKYNYMLHLDSLSLADELDISCLLTESIIPCVF